MKRPFILIAIAAAAACWAVDPALRMLLRPRLSARTSYMQCPPRTLDYPECTEPARGWLSGGETGLTFIVWMRYTSANGETNRPPFVSGSCTIEAARPTLSGGAELTNLVTGALAATPIDMSSGSWSSTCLPNYECPASLSNEWQHGCYCINLSTDAPLTLTVAGTQISVPVTNNMVRNILGSTASRTVSISSSVGAAVVFGVAEMPIRQFIGAQNDSQAGDNSSTHLDVDNGGLAERWRMAVFRARLLGNGSAVTQMDMWTAGGKCPNVGCQTQTLWRARSTFEADAMVRMSVAQLGTMPSTSVHICMAKLLGEWLSDARLQYIRDCDVAEFQRQGMTFPELTPDYRTLELEFSRTTVSEDISETASTNGQAYALTGTQTTTSNHALATVIHGVNYSGKWGDADYLISCPGATVSGHEIDFPTRGTYIVTATDPTGGFVANQVSVSAPSTSVSARLDYLSDGGYAAQFNSRVASAVIAATNNGTLYHYVKGTVTNSYYKWQCTRLWGCPAACTSAQGHYSKHAISPHVVASAAHYGWWPAAAMTFTSANGTSATVTPTNVVNAQSWALANGFTSEEVAAADIGDLVLMAVDGEIPADCCPWFMSTDSWAVACPGPFGILGWHGTQTDIGMGLPVLIKPDISFVGHGAKWQGARDFPFPSSAWSWLSASQLMPALLFAGVTPPTMFAPTYSGDSGLPIYLEDAAGRQILIANHHTATTGTSYVRALGVIQAYAATLGDELKIWTP